MIAQATNTFTESEHSRRKGCLFITHNALPFSSSTTDPAHYASMNHWGTRLTRHKFSVSQTFPGSEEGHLIPPSPAQAKTFSQGYQEKLYPLLGAVVLKVNVLCTATDA